MDTLRAAVDYIRQLRCLLGQPILDEHLHRGPVLITDAEADRQSLNDESFDLGSTTRCDSSMSNPELTSMMFTLPPMDDFRSASPSSSVSSTSTSNNQVDSTNGTFYDDIKENLTQEFHLIEDIGQANWNWTTVAIQDDQP